MHRTGRGDRPIPAGGMVALSRVWKPHVRGKRMSVGCVPARSSNDSERPDIAFTSPALPSSTLVDDCGVSECGRGWSEERVKHRGRQRRFDSPSQAQSSHGHPKVRNRNP